MGKYCFNKKYINCYKFKSISRKNISWKIINNSHNRIGNGKKYNKIKINKINVNIKYLHRKVYNF